MIFHSKKQTGFSLVETLVAIAILLIVIAGPMAISSRTAKSSSFASEQVQAFFLAQEGVELAQKAKDQFFLEHFADEVVNDQPWAEFSDEFGNYEECYSSEGCGLEWGSVDGELAPPVDCTGTACRLYKNDSAGRSQFTYNTIANGETPFTRKIYFTANGNSDVKIKSVVTWRTGSIVADQRVEVDTYLYNIYDKP